MSSGAERGVRQGQIAPQLVLPPHRLEQEAGDRLVDPLRHGHQFKIDGKVPLLPVHELVDRLGTGESTVDRRLDQPPLPQPEAGTGIGSPQGDGAAPSVELEGLEEIGDRELPQTPRKAFARTACGTSWKGGGVVQGRKRHHGTQYGHDP